MDVYDYGVSLATRQIFFICEDELSIAESGRFLKHLKLLECKKDPIIIHSYCYGGEWENGMMVYDAIVSSPCSFIFVCHGTASSMGSLIPQAVIGKGYRITMPHTEWMVHEGNMYVEKNNKAGMSQLEANRRVLERMYDIYAEACVNGEFFKDDKISKVKSYLKRKLSIKEDWMMDGKEAVYYGLADGVLGSEGYETIDKIKGYL